MSKNLSFIDSTFIQLFNNLIKKNSNKKSELKVIRLNNKKMIIHWLCLIIWFLFYKKLIIK